jgi:L-arabinose isomerase
VTAPLVIWNAPAIARLPDGLTQAQATEHTTTVGALMYGNVRVREGRPPLVVTAGHDDAAAIDRMLRTVRAAAAGGSLRGGTVLRVGDAIPGYLDVDATAADLAALGLREVAVDLPAWEAAVESADAGAAAAALGDATRRWAGDPGPQAGRSARVAVALDAAMAGAGAVAGTVNCHGPWFRSSERVGVTACLAVACQAERGRSVACTGDQPTAIVLHLARLLTGSALYCEGYTPEAETGLLLVAAGGEGDPAWAEPPGAVTLEANDHYPGVHGNGTGLAFQLRRGPATLLSLSPTQAGWMLAWATGEVVESRYQAMRGPNGMFRFDSGPAVEAVEGWIASGATHHSALARGRLDVEVPALAASLGLRAVRV